MRVWGSSFRVYLEARAGFVQERPTVLRNVLHFCLVLRRTANESVSMCERESKRRREQVCVRERERKRERERERERERDRARASFSRIMSSIARASVAAS